MAQEANKVVPGSTPEPPSSDAGSSAQYESELLARRRRWFRSFPEGRLEFIAVIRLLWVIGLFVLPLMPAVERVYGTMALGIVFIVDAALALAWVAQMLADRNSWMGEDAFPSSRPARPWGLCVALVILSYLLLFSFGATFLHLPWETARVHPGAVRVVRWMLLAAYIASVPIVWSSLRSLGVRSQLATALLAVPLLHWWAVRHIGANVAAEFARRTISTSPDEAAFSRAAVVAADAVWTVWLVVMAVIFTVSGLRAGLAWQPACCSLLAAVAGIADMAAMEAIQRAYLAYVQRRQGTES